MKWIIWRENIMARRTISLDEKIEKAQKEVAVTKNKYDAAVEEL